MFSAFLAASSQGRGKEDAIEAYTAALQEDSIPVPEDRLDTILVAV